MEEFTHGMGLDAILTAREIREERIGPNRTHNEWGVISEATRRGCNAPVKGIVEAVDDLRRYSPPAPCAPGRNQSLERLVNKLKRQY